MVWCDSTVWLDVPTYLSLSSTPPPALLIELSHLWALKRVSVPSAKIRERKEASPAAGPREAHLSSPCLFDPA